MNKSRVISIFLFFVLAWLLVSCNATKFVADNERFLRLNIIKSDTKELKTSEIYNYLKQQENTKTALFFNFHLWIYNISHEKDDKVRKFKKFIGIYKMGEIIGEPPVILDSNLNLSSVHQIKKYMRNRGYYRSEVKDSIVTYGKHKKNARVYYLIKAGEPILIDTVEYAIIDTIISRIVMEDTSRTLLTRKSNLDVDLLQKERLRVSELLKTNGYFKFSKEYIYYKVDTANVSYCANVELKIINPSDTSVNKQYVLNNIYYFNGFEPQEYLKNKLNYCNTFDTIKYKDDYFLSLSKPFVKPKIIFNSSYLRKSNMYSSVDVKSTFRHLSSLNEYKLINIRYNELKDTSKIDVLVQLTPFSKHNYIAELEGTNSSGNLGIGGRLSYQHKSLFRGAEILNISVYGKIESQNSLVSSANENIAFNSEEVGATVSLSIPKFFLPFVKTDHFIKKNNPKTIIEFDLNNKNRPEYTRSIYSGSFGYYWVSPRFFRHRLNVLDISAVKVYNMDPDYYKSIQNTYLEKSFDDYLIVALDYSLFFTNKKERKGKSYFYTITKAEIAGNALNLYSKLSNAEKIDGSYHFLNNTYAQYWKLELDFRFIQIINKRQDKIVYRIYTGIANPYGNVTAMPYVKQFYSGGANGMRAWPVRSLGPGSYYNPNRKYYNESADFKLEGNLEFRYKLFWVMEGALFIDAGNIWATNSQDPREGAFFELNDFYNEIAIGTGLGLRFDFSFFIFRLDYGIRVKDPKEPIGDRWILLNSKYNPFNGDYSMFNFGIGYPF